ncbi:hypothetical protein [Burkholderia glumae]
MSTALRFLDGLALAAGGPKALLGQAHLSSCLHADHRILQAAVGFDSRFRLDSMTAGARGWVVYATDAGGNGASRDYSLYSTDAGKSWTRSGDGVMQGGHFDSDTSMRYSLYAYTLKKRKM